MKIVQRDLNQVNQTQDAATAPAVRYNAPIYLVSHKPWLCKSNSRAVYHQPMKYIETSSNDYDKIAMLLSDFTSSGDLIDAIENDAFGTIPDTLNISSVSLHDFTS